MQKPPSNSPLILSSLYSLHHHQWLSSNPSPPASSSFPPSLPLSSSYCAALVSNVVFLRAVLGFLSLAKGVCHCALQKFTELIWLWGTKWWGSQNQDLLIYINRFTDKKQGGCIEWRIMEGVGEMELRRVLMTLAESSWVP